MARYHATKDGQVPFTPEEEAEYDAIAAAWIAGEPLRKAKEIRDIRDKKLAETDWRFRSDMEPSQAWKSYCQALRDIPSQAGFPWEVQWPTQPE